MFDLVVLFGILSQKLFFILASEFQKSDIYGTEQYRCQAQPVVVYVEAGYLLEAEKCLAHVHSLAPEEQYILNHLNIVRAKIQEYRQKKAAEELRLLKMVKVKVREVKRYQLKVKHLMVRVKGNHKGMKGQRKQWRWVVDDNLEIIFPISLKRYEPRTWQNQQNGCAPREDSDHPGHPPSLIRVFAVALSG